MKQGTAGIINIVLKDQKALCSKTSNKIKLKDTTSLHHIKICSSLMNIKNLYLNRVNTSIYYTNVFNAFFLKINFHKFSIFYLLTDINIPYDFILPLIIYNNF